MNAIYRLNVSDILSTNCIVLFYEKKQIIVLSGVAAVAIATFVGKKAYEPSLSESSNLLMQNVEALTQGGENQPQQLRLVPCSRKPISECVSNCVLDYPECSVISYC